MEISYSPYRLTPKKQLNRLSSMAPKDGVYLSAVINGTKVFADYFPHPHLGDEPVDKFLAGLKDQKTEYNRKILKLLTEDQRYQKMPVKKFKNHQLWSGVETIIAPVIKYKLQSLTDTRFHEALKKGIRVRLDANAMFNANNLEPFLAPLSEQWRALIDYVEDPMPHVDWSSFPLPKARDFVEGNPYDYYIYKPNCEDKPSHSNIIYSAYMSSNLGTWHVYCDMIEHGDLSRTQGIMAPAFYEEVQEFQVGDYISGFTPDLEVIRDMYRDLNNREWKTLCSM